MAAFKHGLSDYGNGGYLRPDVEMQQLQAIQHHFLAIELDLVNPASFYNPIDDADKPSSNTFW